MTPTDSSCRSTLVPLRTDARVASVRALVAPAVPPGSDVETSPAVALARRTARVRLAIAGIGIALSVASVGWIDVGHVQIYAVFFALAFAFSFVWADSETPTSVPYMATASAFVYIGSGPILAIELLARLTAYPLLFLAARRGLLQLPRPLRATADTDPARARAARVDLAAMLGLAAIGSGARLAAIDVLHALDVTSPIGIVVAGEMTAYGLMGLLSSCLPLPSSVHVASPFHLPADDERVEVIFSAVLIVPFLVLLVTYGYLLHGIVGAAAWSVATLAPHWLVQMLAHRRHLMSERAHALRASNAALTRRHREVARSRQQAVMAYRELQAAQGRLLQTEKLASLGRVVAGVAHEINNPISFIVGNLDPVQRKLSALERAAMAGNDDEVLRLSRRISGIVDTIGRGAERTAAVVRDLRAFCRLGDVERGPCDVHDGLELALRLLAPKWTGRITIERAYGELPPLVGVRGQLDQVFTNLLANACDAIPHAGTIRIATACRGQDLCVTIADDGVGIAAGDLDRIFDPFFTTKAQGCGTGLGLAISHGIVEDHGGRIDVESRSGTGTCVTVRLPRPDRRAPALRRA